MSTAKALTSDIATNEWQEVVGLQTQGENPGSRNDFKQKVLSTALLAALATTPNNTHTLTSSASFSFKEVTTSLFSYRPENRLSEKLEQTISRLQQYVFEYIARVTAIDNASGYVTLEANIGDEQTYFDWEISKLPFAINKFSSIKIFGYLNHKGVEKVRFIEMPDEELDEVTLAKLADLRYVKNSRP